MNKRKGEIDGFPSDFLSESEKSTREYHLQYCKAAYEQHTSSSYFGSLNYRKTRLYELKNAARGIIDVDRFKPVASGEDNTSYLNLNYDVVSPMPKFVRILTNEMIKRGYKVQAKAIDALSKTRFDIEKNKMLAEFYKKKAFKKLEEKLGAELTDDTKKIPESSEELELYFDTNFKQDTELEVEQVTAAILAENDGRLINKNIVQDLTSLAYTGTKVERDENDDIRVRWVDVLKIITSPGVREDFKDRRFIGEEITMKVYDIKKLIGNEYTEKEIWTALNGQIGKDFQYRSFNESWTEAAPYDSHDVKVLDLEWKTPHKIVYELRTNKFGGQDMVLVDDDYKIPENTKYPRELVEKEFNYIHKAKWLIDTDIIFDYGAKEDMIREKTNGWYSADTPFSYTLLAPGLYEEDNKSLVEQALFAADQMSFALLRMQHLLAVARPPGIAFDVSALNDVVMGNGGEYMKPLEIMDIYNELGIALFSSVREDGTTIQNSKPIFELNQQMSGDMERLIGLYNHYLQVTRDIFGLNEFRDGSTPKQDTLNGVMEMALSASNNATGDIEEGYKNVIERTARLITLHVQHLVEDGKKEFAFKNVIGEVGHSIIKMSEGVPLCEFGIYVTFSPNAEARAGLVKAVELAQRSNPPLITPDAALLVNRIAEDDVKLAERHLSFMIRKHEERVSEMKERDAMTNAQVQQQAAKAKAEMDAQMAQMNAQIKEQEEAKAHERAKELKEMEAEIEYQKITLQMQADIRVVQESKKGENGKEGKGNSLENTSTGTKQVKQPSINPSPVPQIS